MLLVFHGFCPFVYVPFQLHSQVEPKRRFCLESEIGPEHQYCNDLHSLHKCTIPLGPSSVMKYCPLSTVFKPALEHSLDNFCLSDSCSNCCSYSFNKFHRRCSSVRGSAMGRSVSISIVSKRSCASGFPPAMVSLDTSLHISASAP